MKKAEIGLIMGLVIFVALLGVPMMASAHGGDTSLVHACVNPSGLTRIIGPNDSCSSSETPTHWSSTTPRTVPATFTVDCGLGQTIGDKLKDLIPGDTLLVSGVCNERVVIREGVHRITLDGQGTATINGPGAARSTIAVRGRRITIRGFTITGGTNGIEVREGGAAVIEGNTIQFTGDNGITVTFGGFAEISGNTIQNNLRRGITQFENASTQIQNNIVQRNGESGIEVGSTSSAIILSNTISNNGENGIRIVRSSQASIGNIDGGGNTISSNGITGILVVGSSQANIEGNTISNHARSGIRLRFSHSFINANTISDSPGGVEVEENSSANLDFANTGINNTFGVVCRLGAHVGGTIGTLGPKSFDATCIDALSP